MNPWRTAPEFAQALRLYEAGHTRAAHEAFEATWRAHRACPLGRVARALAQWTAACIHLEAGRERGFRALAARSAQGLSDGEIATRHATQALAAWIDERARAPHPGASRPLGG